MKEIRNWFPFYPQDWISDPDLQLCSLKAQGMLAFLMALSWTSGTPGIVRKSESDLSHLMRLDPEECKELLKDLKDRKRIKIQKGSIIIPRLKIIGKEQEEKHRKRVEAGRKGGQKSKRVKEKAPRKSRKKKAVPPEQEGQFETFWNAVPNKIARGYAEECFVNALQRATFAEIMAGIPAFVKYEQKRIRSDPNCSALHPSTWLNQDRWKDDLKFNKKEKVVVKLNLGTGEVLKFRAWTKEEAEEKKLEYIMEHGLQKHTSQKGIEYYVEAD